MGGTGWHAVPAEPGAGASIVCRCGCALCVGLFLACTVTWSGLVESVKFSVEHGDAWLGFF